MTVYQTDFRPAWVEPVPEPRVQIQRMMLATSMLIDGFVDTNPSRSQAYLSDAGQQKALASWLRSRSPH